MWTETIPLFLADTQNVMSWTFAAEKCTEKHSLQPSDVTCAFCTTITALTKISTEEASHFALMVSPMPACCPLLTVYS